ncbi:Phosphoribosylformylglycinamidine synthase subunit PurL [bacterium HR17]|uniref:Phosphoribosylformylglycinamidine synthase subunit PurL n=1 Tax=Candidatus Fervidibacter japonicus TaxID=2035412 RepID=A0A2H5XC63_9BACT|nr:Phosphoribosylformylglycinamidine synthase subunit PurL [bacterium HR17]
MAETTLQKALALGMTEEEFRQVCGILGRTPTDTELAMFSVEWSEHCGYGRSKRWLKLLPRDIGKYRAAAGGDAGGIEVKPGLWVLFKMESHNHPSQIEPKSGAATGIGGIVRDILAMGARPIALVDTLRFADPSDPKARYIFTGVVDGISFYGNCIGVPTVAGEVGFNDCYRTNCLVGVMCVGVAWEHELMTSAAKGIGNAVVYVGNATGRDGIGGCSILASQEMREELAMRPTVQLGDPFAEKCLIEACLEAYKTGAVVAVKDMGAAGLTCTTVEMAAAGGVGMVVDIALVPKREPDMQPWEVMMSESQERMLLVVERGREWEVKQIFDKWGLHCVVIGRITDDGIVRIYDGMGREALVAEIPAKDIAEAPVKNLPMQKPDYLDRVRAFDVSQLPEPDDYAEALLHLLASPNIASKAWVYEQYDHMVQINTVVLPGAADAAVLRLKDWDERLGIAVTADCNPLYCYLDPYRGAQLAVAEAARNLSCVGAEPAGVTDCLCFGNPDKPDRYWQFVECVKGIADACHALNVPVVSGNVSFYNESETSVIHPSPLIGMVGVLDDVRRHATMAFKDAGDLIVLLGVCRDELGGSEYVRWRFGLEVGEPPQLDWRLEKAVQMVCREGIRDGFIKSAHDCSEGGLAVCLAECCIAGDIGAKVVVPAETVAAAARPSAVLFGETASRIVVTVAPDRLDELMAVAQRHQCPAFVLGEVGGDELSVTVERVYFSVPVGDLRRVWASLPSYLE